MRKLTSNARQVGVIVVILLVVVWVEAHSNHHLLLLLLPCLLRSKHGLIGLHNIK